MVKYITVYYVFVLQGGQKRPGTDFYLGEGGERWGSGNELDNNIISIFEHVMVKITYNANFKENVRILIYYFPSALEVKLYQQKDYTKL